VQVLARRHGEHHQRNQPEMTPVVSSILGDLYCTRKDLSSGVGQKS